MIRIIRSPLAVSCNRMMIASVYSARPTDAAYNVASAPIIARRNLPVAAAAAAAAALAARLSFPGISRHEALR